MKTEQLVRELAEAGIFLAVRDGRLVCKANEGALTPARRTVIGERKAELVAFLSHVFVKPSPDEPVLRARRDGRARLSPAQRRLWFVERLTESGVNYTIPVACRLSGALDVPVLGQALQRVVERHESLRSVIEVHDGEPTAAIREHAKIALEHRSLEALDPQDREAEVRAALQEAATTPFDLTRDIPIRARLLRLQPDAHVFVLTLHHTAADGWSVENLLRELSTLYSAFAAGRADPLPELTLQYSDYAAWQRDWLQGARLERQLGYWREQLAGAPPAHSLPLDRPRPSDSATTGASWRRALPPTLHRALSDTARNQGVTLFMLLQAAFAVLIARWSGETDIVMGTPVANRPREELAPLIGFFANTLAFRTRLDGNPSFSEVLQRTRKMVLDAFDHQNLPFELLVEDLNPPRSLSMAPLLQITFSLQDTDEEASLSLPGIRAVALAPDSSNAKFDLSLNINKVGDGLEACWDYCRDLFDETTIAHMAASFEILLGDIAARPTQTIQRLSLMDDREHTAMLAPVPDAGYPREAGIAELVGEQASARPLATAIVHATQSASYGELERRANGLARVLRSEGVQAGDRVGVCLERGIDLVVTLLAVLKLGAAYVPLDPESPEARLSHMATDTGMKLCVTDGSFSRPAGLRDLKIVPAAGADAADEMPEMPPAEPCGGDRLAYVMYTSGSTGLPKGVAVPHRGVVRLVKNTDYVLLDTDTVMAQVSNVAFDAATFEIWGALCNGGRLVILDKEEVLDTAAFVKAIAVHGLTTAFVTTALFNRFAQERPDGFSRLENLLFGGERVSHDAVRRVLEAGKPKRLLHVYGPTENTTFSTWHELDERYVRNPLIPIGRAIARSRAYVVNEAFELQPTGAVGELVLAGDGLAHGYWARPELTAERFVECPADWGTPCRLYRSGDRARRLPSGDFEYIGRVDAQVKIRGFRIEPGEIELHLRSHPAVKDAAVVVREDRGPDARQLVAYWVAGEETGTPPDARALQQHLARHLPPYMLPAAYVAMASLPLTINGKLDRRALPAPGANAYSSSGHAPPETPLQQRLVSMWQDLLKLDEIGIDTDFFDLGGHSLLLTKLHNRIGAQLDVELALRQLFTARTVREQAALVGSAHNRAALSHAPALQPRPPDATPVLSFAQQRLWFIDRMGNAEAVYNIPCVLRLKGVLDIAVLQRALNEIVKRHEVLHTALTGAEGKAWPRVLECFELNLAIEDLRDLAESARDAAVRDRMEAEAARPFRLDRDLMLRAGLLRLAEREHVLLLTLHHVAADGWSIDVLLDEMAELYNAGLGGREPELPVLAVQYADYAHWQRQWLQGDRLASQLAYWERQLAALPVLHNLPLDFARPEAQRYHGDVHWQRLPARLLERVQTLARRHDTTLFVTLQAAFSVLLARWSGDTDVVIGTPIANRRHEELTPLIGFFANTLVLRTDLSGNPRFTEALARARTVALDAYQHQDLPFEMLVDRLSPRRSLGHSPLFQVMMVLEYDGDDMPELAGLTLTDIAGESRHAKFDITLNLRQTADGLEAVWSYCRDLFRADTIARMADVFRNLLEAVIADPERHIGELPLAVGDEQVPAAAIGPQYRLPPVAGVHVLFEQQAAAMPDAIAVRHACTALTYAELDRRANRVAHALLALGIEPDARVALLVERGTRILVGLLGILKAGGACVMLDPSHPPAYVNTLLADSGALAVLCQRDLTGTLATDGLPCLRLDDESALHACADSGPEVAALGPGHLACVAYTAARDGAPKGVMLEHRNLLNLVDDGRRRFADAQSMRASLCTGSGPDRSLFEIFVTLALGGTLDIVPDDVGTDCGRWLDWLAEHRITHACLPPRFLRALDQAADERIAALSLRHVLTGFEPSSEPRLHRLRRLLPGLSHCNVHGSTETTVFDTCHTGIRDLERSIPAGRPIANTRILILDDALQPVPQGMVGEVCVAGDGVARGYLDRPELTREKFVRAASGERMYRTGELARWLPEGQMEFRGRKDRQIMLDGVRIEPEEIERLASDHPRIEACAVALEHDASGDVPRLVAYFVPVSGADVSADALRDHLARHLPADRLPATCVRLAKMPMDSNGEIDLQALPAPATDTFPNEVEAAPLTPLERRLSAIWCDVLGREHVDVDAYFFDLGGNSLCAVRLVAAIQEATGHSLPISVLFKAPSIRTLAEELEQIDAADRSVHVTLRDGDASRPLFVFHAAGGDVLCYQPLLKYLPDSLPVYGFARSESASQSVPALKSIEQLAHEYLDHVLELQPQGSFRLAGWSSGGLLALEIAHRLEKSGREVEFVCLVDTMLPTGRDVPETFRQAGLSALQRMPDAETCRMMRDYDPELMEATPRNGVLEIPTSAYFDYLVAANQIGLDFYRPVYRLATPVHYFACSRNREVKTVDERVDELQSLAIEPMTCLEFDASHFSIMEEPDVAGLGRAIAGVIAMAGKSGEDPESGMCPMDDRAVAG
jgi:amino acid adenylation domain-containing protein